ncbi:MAG: LysM peptidoglycan-binding domain-containing protein [Desulfobulbaceae bacterium]|nr:LysM peptidoglycan-binding domain-containing protein [Desulfobulbaceae bacterium]
MSTDKNSLPNIPLLAGMMVLFIACAPLQPTSGNYTDNTPVGQQNQAQNISQTTDQDNAESNTSHLEEENSVVEPEQTVSEEVKELASLDNWEEGAAAEEKEVTYDFPVTINRQVEFYLNFFQTKQRTTFSRWLARSGRYLPLFQQKLKEAGLPQDLAYLAMIESGFNLTAYSSAGAAGPWQFMRSTGSHYGLKINRYTDERRDPIKSTDAAIKYLSKLYNDFGSWQLAVAAYNAGEGRVRRAIRHKKGTNDFWKLAQGRTLSIETKRYVPKLIAAIMIAKNPSAYGFTDITLEPALAYEEVTTPPWTSLAAVAVAGNIDSEELHNLNRQLRRAITPPGPNKYTLKVPLGKGDIVTNNLSRVHASITTKFRTHIVKRTDSLSKIGHIYNLNKTTLLKANNLRGPSLKVGQRLQIPFQTTQYTLLSEKEMAGYKGAAAINPDNLLLHRIRPGETLSHLSKLYNVPVHLIASWNGLKSVNSIRAGQQLALYLDKASQKLAAQPLLGTHTASNTLTPSQQASQHITYYMVRGGDSLWTIAKRFNLTTDEIRRWNDLDGDLIKPGATLVIKDVADLGV